MYGNQIVLLFQTGFPDWETGSALALFLIGVITLLTLVFVRFLRVGEAQAT
jgi:ABC-type spermidine/putrescine transport system permease subunit I